MTSLTTSAKETASIVDTICLVECDNNNIYLFVLSAFFTVGLSGENVAMESLLPIVASQRERFKIRNMELEAVSNYPV